MTRTDKTSKMLRLLADQLDQDIGYVPDFAFVMVVPDTDEVMHTQSSGEPSRSIDGYRNDKTFNL